MADDIHKARIDEFFQHRAEIHRSMLNMAIEYFKYMAILNGGAAAGIVASVDKLIEIIDRTSLKIALLCFSLGLILNAVALFSTYFNQARIRYASHADLARLAEGAPSQAGKKRTPFFYVSLTCCVGSLAAFCGGIAAAALGIRA